MRDLLIIYLLPQHKGLLEGQCRSLKEYNIHADALLLMNHRIEYLSSNTGKAPFLHILYAFLFNKLFGVKGMGRLGVLEFLRRKALESLAYKYKILELTGNYRKEILEIAHGAQRRGIRIVAQPWDHYVADWHNELYQLSDVINVGAMKSDYLSMFPQFSEKYVSISYGLSQLELLNDLLDGRVQKDISFINNEAQGKTIITIGYSGRAWHQHFYAVDAIKKLPNDIKSSLFLLFPMTYSNKDSHYNFYINQKIKECGIPYQILNQHLPLIQNLSMRIISDVVINCQLNDANSSSIQEHLMAGSVLVAGDWLPYINYSDYGVHLHVTTLDSMSKTIYNVLNNLDEEKYKCKKNRSIIYNLNSWKNKGKEFANLYNNLLELSERPIEKT